MVELLWDLSHRDDMNRELVEKALDQMYHVMVDNSSLKESYKKKYLDRCIDSIKKGANWLSGYWHVFIVSIYYTSIS